MIRIAVVGAGLSGLSAAIFAANEGAQVTVVALGEGGLSLSHGGIELWASASPSRSLARLKKGHPYQLAGSNALHAGLSKFRKLLKECDVSFDGGISTNRGLLTAVGAIRQVAFTPAGSAVAEPLRKAPAAIAILPGLRDYFPELIVQEAKNSKIKLGPLIDLPLIDIPDGRGLYALDLARRFEDLPWRREILRAWKPKLTGVNRLVLPACLGLRSSKAIRAEVETELGVNVFEIALLPPTIPGFRLEKGLHSILNRLGVDMIEGAQAIGRYDGASGGKRTAGLVIETAGASHSIDAEAVILATGGVLHGGILALQTPEFRETVFTIPLDHPKRREDRVAISPFMPQPYQLAGVRVNASMQPIGADGKPFLDNLFAAGGIIAGADRTKEGSRQGIDIATAYKSVLGALKTSRPGRKTASSRKGK